VRLALGWAPDIIEVRDAVADNYLIRDYDTKPLIASLEEIVSQNHKPLC
jgi:hypothetical protein